MLIAQILSANDTLVISAQFPTCSAGKLFEYWIEPHLLRQWWPPVVEVEPRVGGTYHFSWPQMEWHLRGCYTTLERGIKLAFTWQWDHHPIQEDVVVTFEPLGEQGTTMTIVHGPYDNSKQSQEDRQSHLDGWLYFVTKLQKVTEN